MVFQDPMATLKPDAHGRSPDGPRARGPRPGPGARAAGALPRPDDPPRIPAPEGRLAAYPHELSGGLRQRVAIAVALLNRPSIVIADEPTTALDVSIQAQILREMTGLVRETGLAMIWISHDLAVVSSIAQRIAVMYAGRIVEDGPVRTVLRAPRHPTPAGSSTACRPRRSPVRRWPRSPGRRPRSSHARRAARSIRVAPGPPRCAGLSTRSDADRTGTAFVVTTRWRRHDPAAPLTPGRHEALPRPGAAPR